MACAFDEITKKEEISVTEEKINFCFPHEAAAICAAISSHGYEICLVGGCVRDYFMGRQAHDTDLTTNAPSAKIIEILADSGFYAYDKGGNCGTIGVRIDGFELEITPYRSEWGYYDHRHPKNVVFEDSIEKDLSRRDFTINAMAISYDGRLYDLFGGREDINNKLIRCVGNPDERFCEDALRILRALRFSAKLGFGVEENTKKAIFKNKHLLGYVSGERKNDELHGILLCEKPYEVLREYEEVFSHILCRCMPCGGIDSLPRDFALRLFYLTKDTPIACVKELADKLKLKNLERIRLIRLKEIYDSFDFSQKELLNEKTALYVLKYGELFYEFLSAFEIDFDAEKRPGCIKDLDIDGNELEQIGFRGKRIGEVFEKLFVLTFLGEIENSRTALEKTAKNIKEKELL